MSRGGYREGAGRKPLGKTPGRQIKVVLTEEQEEALGHLAERLGGDRKLAAAIRRALSVGIAALRAAGEIPPQEALKEK